MSCGKFFQFRPCSRSRTVVFWWIQCRRYPVFVWTTSRRWCWWRLGEWKLKRNAKAENSLTKRKHNWQTHSLLLSPLLAIRLKEENCLSSKNNRQRTTSLWESFSNAQPSAYWCVCIAKKRTKLPKDEWFPYEDPAEANQPQQRRHVGWLLRKFVTRHRVKVISISRTMP